MLPKGIEIASVGLAFGPLQALPLRVYLPRDAITPLETNKVYSTGIGYWVMGITLPRETIS